MRQRERECAQAAKATPTSTHSAIACKRLSLPLSLTPSVYVCVRETRLAARRNNRWAAAADSRARSVRPTGSSLVRSPRSLARSFAPSCAGSVVVVAVVCFPIPIRNSNNNNNKANWQQLLASRSQRVLRSVDFRTFLREIEARRVQCENCCVKIV